MRNLREGWNTNETALNVNVTGQALSTSLGSVTTTAEVNVGWGRTEWGAQAWGSPNEAAAINGFGLSASLGSVSITSQVNTGD